MSVYDKSLEQIQSSYQFTDLEMAKMDYTLKVFAYELSKLVFFFVFFAVIGKFSEFAVCLIALLPFRWISGGIHLKHYWSCFIFSFCFFAVILFMGEMFTLPLYAQISLFVLSNLLLFFIGPVPSAKRKVMTKKQYTNKRFLSSFGLHRSLFCLAKCAPSLCRFLEHHFTNYTINLCQVDTERRDI